MTRGCFEGQKGRVGQSVIRWGGARVERREEPRLWSGHRAHGRCRKRASMARCEPAGAWHEGRRLSRPLARPPPSRPKRHLGNSRGHLPRPTPRHCGPRGCNRRLAGGLGRTRCCDWPRGGLQAAASRHFLRSGQAALPHRRVTQHLQGGPRWPHTPAPLCTELQSRRNLRDQRARVGCPQRVAMPHYVTPDQRQRLGTPGSRTLPTLQCGAM